MHSDGLDLSKYDTDKVNHQYLDLYAPMLAPWRDKPVHLLELGILKGGSLRLWRDYFPQGTIAGIDRHLPKDFAASDRIQVFKGSQTDCEFLSRVAREVAPAGFDIIIDDASHMGVETKTSFWHLFDRHLKPGGLYVIEDWGTGYWDDWPDGKSLDLATYSASPRPKKPFPNHSYGMVGFVKQLVDELAASDVTRQNMSGTPLRGSRFERVLFMPSVVFVSKRF